MELKRIAPFVTLLFAANTQAIPLHIPDGHISTDLEIEVFSTTSVRDDDSAVAPGHGAVLTTTVDYENNNPPAFPGSAHSYGDAFLSVQYGRVAGVSNWYGMQPQPWFGHGGTASSILSSGSFTIPDITIQYRGVGAAANQISGDVHVSTDIVGWGRHVVDIIASVNPSTSSLQDKRIVDVLDGPVEITNLVTSFDGFSLPVGNMFDLSILVDVQSLSRSYPLQIDEVGVKNRSWVNWSVELGGSPAFVLPEGYFASSADGSIVDNYFVSAVPVPAAAWLFASGLLGLIGIARRKTI